MRAVVLVIVCALIGGAWQCSSMSILGCDPIPPKQLLSGAPPGTVTEEISGGAKEAIWGTGADRLEQVIDVSLYEPGADEHLADVDVRANPGLVYRIHRDFSPSVDQRLALGWSEGGCEYTVLFAPSVAAEEVIDFAPRY